jgi:hypothetical protein
MIKQANYTVYVTVLNAVDRAVRMGVYWAMYDAVRVDNAVRGAVNRAVNGAVYWAVNGAVYWAVDRAVDDVVYGAENSARSVLSDFLLEVGN